MANIKFTAKFLKDPVKTLEFVPEIVNTYIQKYNMKYFRRNIDGDVDWRGLREMRDDIASYRRERAKSRGYGSLYQAEKVSKTISPTNHFKRTTLEKWVEKKDPDGNRLMEGKILYNKNKKVETSEINLDHVEFWTRWLPVLEAMDKSGVREKLNAGWQYVNPWTNKGKTPKEFEVDTIMDIVISMLQELPPDKKQEFIKSLEERD